MPASNSIGFMKAEVDFQFVLRCSERLRQLELLRVQLVALLQAAETAPGEQSEEDAVAAILKPPVDVLSCRMALGVAGGSAVTMEAPVDSKLAELLLPAVEQEIVGCVSNLKGGLDVWLQKYRAA